MCKSGGHWTHDCTKKGKSEPDKTKKLRRDKHLVRPQSGALTVIRRGT